MILAGQFVSVMDSYLQFGFIFTLKFGVNFTFFVSLVWFWLWNDSSCVTLDLQNNGPVRVMDRSKGPDHLDIAKTSSNQLAIYQKSQS